MTEDLYEVLGVDRNVSKTELKKAYRAKAKEYHPDKNPDDQEAEKKFKDVAYAYEVLTDDNKKARYDQGGHNALNGTPPQGQRGGFGRDMFEEMIRQQNEANQRRQSSIVTTIHLDLEDIYNGVTKKFKYNRQIKCTTCNGLGGTNPSVCETCKGTGRAVKVTSTPFGHMQEIGRCNTCQGKGTTFESGCGTCNGIGAISSREEIEIEIPHGIASDTMFHRQGDGHEMPNGGFGDLLMKILVRPHPKFERQYDNDLISTIKVPYVILMLGGKVPFTTIDGGKVNLTIKKLSKLGAKLKLTGKGLRKLDWKHSRGDQFLVLDIEIPDSVSTEEKELLEKMKKLKK